MTLVTVYDISGKIINAWNNCEDAEVGAGGVLLLRRLDAPNILVREFAYAEIGDKDDVEPERRIAELEDELLAAQWRAGELTVTPGDGYRTLMEATRPDPRKTIPAPPPARSTEPKEADNE